MNIAHLGSVTTVGEPGPTRRSVEREGRETATTPGETWMNIPFAFSEDTASRHMAESNDLYR